MGPHRGAFWVFGEKAKQQSVQKKPTWHPDLVCESWLVVCATIITAPSLPTMYCGFLSVVMCHICSSATSHGFHCVPASVCPANVTSMMLASQRWLHCILFFPPLFYFILFYLTNKDDSVLLCLCVPTGMFRSMSEQFPDRLHAG